MSEVTHGQGPEGSPFSDREFVEQVLGVAVLPPEPPDDAPYDERSILFREVIAARETMRNSMTLAALEAGIPINDFDVSNWQPNEQETMSLQYQLADQRKRAAMINGLQMFGEDLHTEADRQGVPLRPYQTEPIAAVSDFMVHAPRDENGTKSGVIEMPTATGKTAVFANIVSQLKYGESEDNPVRVLILVPTKRILKQTVGEGGVRGFGKFAPHLDVGVYYQEEKDTDKEVVVMTNASFNRLSKSGELGEFDAIIVDEAHMVIGDETSDGLEQYWGGKIVIGLTATPEYNPERSVYDVFDHQIYQMPFKESVHAGRLSPVVGYHHEIQMEVELQDLPLDREERRKAMRAARLEARIEYSQKLIKQKIEEGYGIIVRCPAGDDIDVAVTLAERLREQLVEIGENDSMRWIDAYAIGGSSRRQSEEERDQINQAFNYGDIDVLTYVKAIGIGWDSPHAKILIDLSPTTSAVEMKQNIGRVMRLLIGPDGKPIIAEVHTFADPDLGDKQYNCLDALESKPGELITHHENSPTIIPTPPRYRPVAPEILHVEVETIGELALEHSAEAIVPDGAEVKATVENVAKSTVTFDEACDILCIEPALLKRVLKSVRINPRTQEIPTKELESIMELYPDLQASPVPDNGFTLLQDVVELASKPVRTLSVLADSRRYGYTPLRMSDNNGKIGFYFHDADVEQILELIEAGRIGFRVDRRNK